MTRYFFDRKGNPVYCKVCGSPMMHDPHCSGDWYPCQNGTVLMAYCSNRACGIMVPILGYDAVPPFSKNCKKMLSARIATVYRLPHRATREIALDIDATDRHHHVPLFQQRIKETFDVDIPVAEMFSYCKF